MMSIPSKQTILQSIKSLQLSSHSEFPSSLLPWISCHSNLLKPNPSLKTQLKCHCLLWINQSNKCSSFIWAALYFLSLLLRTFYILCLRWLLLVCLRSPVKDHTPGRHTIRLPVAACSPHPHIPTKNMLHLIMFSKNIISLHLKDKLYIYW